jgi:hypothetical protein
MFTLRKSTRLEFPVELDEFDKRILHHVMDKRLSMVSPERLLATLMSCRYVCESGVAGAFVECGVWRGGNSIIAADVFGRHEKDRRVLLFDTFEGMTEPTEHDFDNRRRKPARNLWEMEQRSKHSKLASAWECVLRPRKRPYATLDNVKRHFLEAHIAGDRCEFIKGDVIETLNIECNLPQRISVLRLDTDWYESTKKELEVLWPRLSPGGVLMVDDYGHWAGAKKAVDEYFDGHRPFFHYIDHTGRLAVKA